MTPVASSTQQGVSDEPDVRQCTTPKDCVDRSDLMSPFPRNGEVWWLSDVLMLVLFDDRVDECERNIVVGLALFDIDDVFKPGEQYCWSSDHLSMSVKEPNRRIV